MQQQLGTACSLKAMLSRKIWFASTLEFRDLFFSNGRGYLTKLCILVRFLAFIQGHAVVSLYITLTVNV